MYKNILSAYYCCTSVGIAWRRINHKHLNPTVKIAFLGFDGIPHAKPCELRKHFYYSTEQLPERSTGPASNQELG